MNTTPESDRPKIEERIRAIAYALWEEEGRPDGRDQIHWMKACAMAEAETAREREAAKSIPAPDWLLREPLGAEPAVADKSTTIEQLSKRVAGNKAS